MKKFMRPATFFAALCGLFLMGACSSHAGPQTANPAEDPVQVGYGEQESRDVSGAISSVTNSSGSNTRYSRIEEMIRGRVPGVQVLRKANGDYSIRIRGGTDFVGSGEPLIVVDGMPLSEFSSTATLSGLAPADVERIDILKDAGAAAIYGTRAANGVIVITTRRGN